MKLSAAQLLRLDGMLVHHRVSSMKQLGALLLPPDGKLVHHRVPSMKQLRALLIPLNGMLVHHRVPSMKQLGVLLLPLDGMLVHRNSNSNQLEWKLLFHWTEINIPFAQNFHFYCLQICLRLHQLLAASWSTNGIALHLHGKSLSFWQENFWNFKQKILAEWKVPLEFYNQPSDFLNGSLITSPIC